MNRHLFRDLLESKPELLTRMLASNAPSQKDVPASLAHWMLEDEALMRALRRRTPQATVTPHLAYWDYTKDSERLALLAPAALKRVALCLAAAIFAEPIAKALDRATVIALKKTLGEELYDYALYRGRYQVGSFKEAFAAYAPTMPLDVRCAMLARALLETIRSDWSETLQEHSTQLFTQLKLPVTSALTEEFVPDVKELWRLMRKILLRELEAQWTSYFV